MVERGIFVPTICRQIPLRDSSSSNNEPLPVSLGRNPQDNARIDTLKTRLSPI